MTISLLSRLRPRSVAKAAMNVVVGLLVVAIGGLLTLNVVVPRLTGTIPLTVFTGSMTGTIPAGSVVLVEPTDPNELEIGDVITFEAAPQSERYITHRIVEIDDSGEERSFVTKGDANPGNDVKPVPAVAVRGLVKHHFPHVGRIADQLRSPKGIAGLVLVPVALIVAMSVHEQLVKRRGKATETDTDTDTDTDTGDVGPGGRASGFTGSRASRSIDAIDAIDSLVAARLRVELLVATVPLGASPHRDLGDVVDLLGGHTVAVGVDAMTVSLTASPERLDDFELLLAAWSPIEVRRSGPLLIAPPVGAFVELPEPRPELGRARGVTDA